MRSCCFNVVTLANVLRTEAPRHSARSGNLFATSDHGNGNDTRKSTVFGDSRCQVVNTHLVSGSGEGSGEIDSLEGSRGKSG
jgi:hypothetical protein